MNNVVLHPQTAATLAKMNALPHALLLSGQRGTGVGTLAQNLATKHGIILACILPKKRSASGSYVVDEAEGSIIIDDIRALYTQTRTRFTTRQIVVIDFADRQMSTQAQNAFLKLLEEPQTNIHFILATHHPELLLPTVVSRCQHIHIQPITSDQTDQLIHSFDIEDQTKVARMKFIATGLPTELKRLASDQVYYESRVQSVQDAKSILEGSSYARLLIVQKYKDKRIPSLQLIDDCLHQLTLALEKTANSAITKQIDALIGAYEKIQSNGNIQLQLINVLL